MLLPDVALNANETKWIARLVILQRGKIYWPIFQPAVLVFLPTRNLTKDAYTFYFTCFLTFSINLYFLAMMMFAQFQVTVHLRWGYT